MSDIIIEIFFVVLLLIANGIFAMAEIAIISSHKTRLQKLINENHQNAKIALDLANNPNNFLSTVQIGITLVGILAGAFGGARIAEKLNVYVSRIDFLSPYSETVSIVFVVLVITYLSLIIGELVPKRIALNNPEKLAAMVARPMCFLSTISSPLVHLLGLSTDAILWILRIKPSLDSPMAEEEIKVLLEQGTKEGTFEAAEQDMVQRIFKFSDQKIVSIMTPRPDIEWLDVNEPVENLCRSITESSYSRLPLAEDDLDKILGIIQVKDLLPDALDGKQLNLVDYLKKPLLVPENTTSLKVLELFKQTGMHIAFVIDEYGGIEGLVTLNDILEAIVGDLPSIDDEEDLEIVKREDGSYLIDGTLFIDEFKELFEVEALPGEENNNYQSLGGFVITYLGKIPSAGEYFIWNSLRFEVMDMDGNRVDKVLVMKIEEEEVKEENLNS